jgi:hypothetical protein
MRLAPLFLLVASLATLGLSANPGRGTVCVAPNSEEPPTRISPGGQYNPKTLMVRIDKNNAIPWPHKESVKIDGLDVNQRHLIVLYSDGKRIQSFWFRFAEFQSPDLCVDFDGYQGVPLQEIKMSPWCKCK